LEKSDEISQLENRSLIISALMAVLRIVVRAIFLVGNILKVH